MVPERGPKVRVVQSLEDSLGAVRVEFEFVGSGVAGGVEDVCGGEPFNLDHEPAPAGWHVRAGQEEREGKHDRLSLYRFL